MWETPFTLSGKPHGELDTQYKRKTILIAANSFPYVKTLVSVVRREQVCPISFCVVCAEMRLFFCHSTCVHSDAFGNFIQERVFGSMRLDKISYFSVLSLLYMCHATIFWASFHDEQNNVWLKENHRGLVWWDRKMLKWKKNYIPESNGNGQVCRRWTWVGMISLTLGPLEVTGI